MSAEKSKDEKCDSSAQSDMGCAAEPTNNAESAIAHLYTLGKNHGFNIYSYGGEKARSFFTGDVRTMEDSDSRQELTDFLQTLQDNKENGYWLPVALKNQNPFQDSDRATPRRKEDAAQALYIQADIDPRVQGAAQRALGIEPVMVSPAMWLAQEQKRILGMLEDEKFLYGQLGVGKPHLIVFSGRGYQAFWRLHTPFPLKTAADIEAVESRNRRLCYILGGDKACVDVTHVFRMPGTVNFPNEKKQREFGVPASGTLARVVHVNERAFTEEGYGIELTSVKAMSADEASLVNAGKATGNASQDNVVSIANAAPAPKKEWCRETPEPLPNGVDGILEDLEALGVSVRTVERIVFGGNEVDPKAYDSRSENMFGVVRELLRRGVPEANVLWIITEPAFAISGHVLDPEKNRQHKGPIPYGQRQITNAKAKNAKDAADEAAERARAAENQRAAPEPARTGGGNGGGDDETPTADGEGLPVFDKGDYSGMARAFRDHVRPHILVGPSGDFLDWTGSCYRRIEPSRIDHDVHLFLERLTVNVPAPRGRTMMKQLRELLDTRCVNETRNALVRIQDTPADKLDLPCWLDEQPGDLPANEIISFPNTLLHLPTMTEIPQTPRFFTRNALEFPFNAQAERPARFLQFLQETWDDDEDCKRLAQEWAGYSLIPNNIHHKMLLLIGVTRGGKGTYARVLESLVGKPNVSWPEADEFGEKFGGEALIGKQLAIIPEFELDNKSPKKRIAARLKSLSGGDSITLQRKNAKNWEGRPGVRIVILANAMLQIPETSGALAGRFIPLPINNSVEGKEDVHLEEKLRAELPGILLWAIEGWKSLTARGKFELGASSIAEQEKIAQASSPLLNFIDDCMRVGGDAGTAFSTKSDVYDVYVRWAKRNGHAAMSKTTFCGAFESAAKRRVRECRPNGMGRGWAGCMIVDDMKPKMDDFYDEPMNGFGNGHSRPSPAIQSDIELDEHYRRHGRPGHDAPS